MKNTNKEPSPNSYSKIKSHILGYPRIGENRELKWALEDYWAGKITQQQLIHEGQSIKQQNWRAQIDAGLDFITVGDFAWYDQVLNMSAYFGVVPKRFDHASGAPVDLDTYFRVARGRAPTGKDAAASDMRKWFNTNYHYIVPELYEGQEFTVQAASLLEEIKQGLNFSAGTGTDVKPVILGPLSYLWLAKGTANQSKDFDVLSLLPNLLNAYSQLIDSIAKQGVQWLQIDEPILVLDLPQKWKNEFERAYSQLSKCKLKLLLATYFSGLEENLTLACQLPCDGLHVDLVAGKDSPSQILDRLPPYKVLSLGVINGRNIWRSDLATWYKTLQPIAQKLKDKLWLSSSCSLLHCPVNVENETSWKDKNKQAVTNNFVFAKQKLDEIALLTKALNTNQEASVLLTSQQSLILANNNTQSVNWLDYKLDRQLPFEQRIEQQTKRFNLPLLPITTIGSFPQTSEIRQARKAFKQGVLQQGEYEKVMKDEIANVITKQEELGIDVLVHGEAERNDMVEYFGQQLDGYEFSENGWVQSYGSRCVKPPIIASDINRPESMTVKWSQYAQSLTDKPVKGMITGPITMLIWSFPREDISLEQQALQLAKALKEEVEDLEQAGIAMIQVDEAALREGLPLRQKEKAGYLNWAINSFRLTVASAKPETQIHTHMCYSQFNDIMPSIAAMDADVISIETSRSNMRLLNAFEDFEYPNQIGPGVYDIHSPIVPKENWMKQLIKKAAKKVPVEQLWINPDCGLKTRKWPETEQALAVMVNVAKSLREEFSHDLNQELNQKNELKAH